MAVSLWRGLFILHWERLALCSDFSGQAGSVSPPELPVPGLRWRSRAHFLVRVCQGHMESWGKLMDRHLNSSGMEKAGSELLMCWTGMLSVQVRGWFWCFFVAFLTLETSIGKN